MCEGYSKSNPPQYHDWTKCPYCLTVNAEGTHANRKVCALMLLQTVEERLRLHPSKYYAIAEVRREIRNG